MSWLSDSEGDSPHWADVKAIVARRRKVGTKPKTYKSPMQKACEKDYASLHNRFYCEYAE